MLLYRTVKRASSSFGLRLQRTLAGKRGRSAVATFSRPEEKELVESPVRHGAMPRWAPVCTQLTSVQRIATFPFFDRPLCRHLQSQVSCFQNLAARSTRHGRASAACSACRSAPLPGDGGGDGVAEGWQAADGATHLPREEMTISALSAPPVGNGGRSKVKKETTDEHGRARKMTPPGTQYGMR